MIARAQKTIVDLNDPIQQETAPADPVEGTLWLDLSQIPPQLKRWSGDGWQTLNESEVGGVNLAALSRISANGTAVVLLEEFTFTITCEAAAYDGCGLKISSAIFAVGGRYILSFQLRRTSGTLSGIGGHMAGYEQAALYVDGQQCAESWNTGISWPDDGAEHRVELHLIYQGNAEDNDLYIQPNRGAAQSGPYSVQISQIQVERGNIATDWYPASEDIQENMELQLTNLRTQLLAATDAIRQEVEASYARADDLDSAVMRQNTLSEQTEDSFTWTIQQLSLLQEDVANGNSSVEERLSEIMSYMTFDATGLTIGKDGSPVTVHIGNDRLSFKVNGGTVAYFSDNRLYVENGEFLGSLKLGKFAFVPQSNGNLSQTLTS